ncbi:MAG: DNA-directed DNA polymerase [archaeon]
MTIQFYPLDFDYSKDGNMVVIGKTIDNERIMIKDSSVKPFFYVHIREDTKNLAEEIMNIRVKQDDRMIKALSTEVVKKRLYDKEKVFVKVYLEHYKDNDAFKRAIKRLGLDVYEDDIKYLKRYLTENDLDPLVLSEVDGDIIEENELGMSVKGEIKQINSEFLKNPKILAFDIEVYGDFSEHHKHKQDPILMVAFKSENFRKVITWKKCELKNYVEVVNNEIELLERFVEIIKEFKPDYITGYFTDGFDFPYIKLRAEELNVRLNIGVDNSNIIIKKNRNGKSSARIRGIPHLDMYRFISKIMGGGLRIDTFNLNTVAREILGDGKNEFDLDDISNVWDKGDIDKLVEYNLKDADLTYQLCKKLIPNMNEISKLVGLPIYDVCRATYGQLVENYLIKKGKEFNEIMPNKPKYIDLIERTDESYEGASVVEPKPDLYKDLVVIDFSGFWPSILVSKNISPSTLNMEIGFKTPEIEIKGVKRNYYFSKNKSFIPEVVKDLINQRRRIKKQLIDSKNIVLKSKSYAIKTVTNAVYGYLGFFGSRYYSLECSASITAFGREYIKKLIDDGESFGLGAIYSDTDSSFFKMNNKTKKDVINFVDEYNEKLPELMELDIENFYLRGIFVSKKGEGGGAKKKYALIDEKGDIKIIGFETVRGDWSAIARETQRNVIELILRDGNFDNALKYIKEILNKVKNKEISLNKMIIKTQLKMNLENYKQIGPHVAVARRMKSLGIKVGEGSVVSFIVSTGKGLIRDRAKLPEECKDYDEEYYINNQVIPVVEKIFEIGNIKKEDLLERGQSKLGDF